MKIGMRLKRLVAFLFAVMLMVSVLAMPVAAAYDVKPCPSCGKSGNVALYDPAKSWTTYSSNTCSHGTGGTDLFQRGTCTLKCWDDETLFSSTERSVLCVATNSRYYY